MAEQTAAGAAALNEAGAGQQGGQQTDGQQTEQQTTGQPNGAQQTKQQTDQQTTGQPNGAQQTGANGRGDAGEVPGFARDLPDELRETVKANGWTSVSDVVANFRSLHSYLGADKAQRGLVLPADENDAEGWQQVYAKLGRPEQPEGYGLQQLEGADPDFAKAAEAKFHELGLTAKQAGEVARWNEEQRRAAQEAETERFNAESARELDELKQAWGNGYEEKLGAARRGAQWAGFDQAAIEKMELTFGTKATLEHLRRLGEAVGEDAMPSGAKAGQARASLEQRLEDKAFMERVHAGDAAAKREWEALHRAAYPESEG